MTSAITFRASSLSTPRQTTVKVAGNLISTPTPANNLRLPPRRFTVTSLQSPENRTSTSSQPSISPDFISSVGSPSLQFTLTQRHFTVLNVAACAVAISATCLFCAAIPTLLAFKRAAESLEKLLDVTREELPDTMAAVRLSGMEITDLTTELSDLGQGFTQGLKRSSNAVRMAEERLRSFADMTSRAPLQEVVNVQSIQTTQAEPAVAKAARGIREGIVKGRTMLNMVFAFSGFTTLVVNYFSKRSRKQPLNE